jgi:hypothetical protein
MEDRIDTAVSPLAGKPAPQSMLVDLARLEREYYERRPDMTDADQRVSFGTSGIEVPRYAGHSPKPTPSNQRHTDFQSA